MLRPEILKRAHASREEGSLAAAEFKRIEDRVVDQAIEIQERVGVDVVTDGEMRRFVFTAPLTEMLDGIVPIEPSEAPALRWHGDNESDDELLPLMFVIAGPLRRRRSLACEEFSYSRARAHTPVKMTLPSPLMLSSGGTRDLPGRVRGSLRGVRGRRRDHSSRDRGTH